MVVEKGRRVVVERRGEAGLEVGWLEGGLG